MISEDGTGNGREGLLCHMVPVATIPPPMTCPKPLMERKNAAAFESAALYLHPGEVIPLACEPELARREVTA